MTSTMAPMEHSRQLLYNVPELKRSLDYERWLQFLSEEENGGGKIGVKGQRDGKHHDRDSDPNTKARLEDPNQDPNQDPNASGGGGGGGGGGGDGDRNNDNGRKNKGSKDNDEPLAVATITAAAASTTVIASAPSTTPVVQLLPSALPAVATNPEVTLTPSPIATTTVAPTSSTTTAAPSLPTTTTEQPPAPPSTITTTSLATTPTLASTTELPLPFSSSLSTPTSILIPSATSATPIATITAEPVQSTSLAASVSSPPVMIISTVTMTMSASAVITSVTATTTEIVILVTSSASRKGEKSHPHHNATNTAVPALADSNGNPNFRPGGFHAPRDPPLSPTAEHLLIAVGVIGGLILLGFLIYLFVRIRKISIGDKFDDFLDRFPRIERLLSVIPAVRKRTQWSRRSSSPGWSSNESYTYDEKPPIPIPSSTHIESRRTTADFTKTPPLSSYGSLAVPGKILTVTNPSASSPSASRSSDSSSFYNVQQPANAYMPNAARMSELSSLSSGFGDAQIDVPESGPTTGTMNSNNAYGSSTMNTNKTNAATINTLQPYRESFMQRASRNFAEPLTSRFSWTTANREDIHGPPGQRDTIYTTTSEDSAPRFRTIHSWVNQQTNRVERGRTEPVPSMPPLPPSQRHLNRASEEPAFRQHPGDEVNIPEATRVDSAILDRKLGV